MFSFSKAGNLAFSQSDFLIRSAFGVSAVSVLIMVPFGINNFFQDRPFSGITSLCVALLFAVNAALTYRGKYSLYLSLFAIVPALAIASITALISLNVVGSYWSYLCVFGIYYILPFHYAKYANMVFLAVVLVVAWISLEQIIAIRFCMVLIGISIFIFISSKEITTAQSVLKKQVNTDSLTGALNRNSLYKCLKEAIDHYKQKDVLSTIFLIDIDHFKKINDNFGHDVGDQVLLDLTAEISAKLKSTDLLFRIGGEEFLVLMHDTNLIQGQREAEQIRLAMRNLPSAIGKQISVSIGISEVNKHSDCREWMKDADEKLYIAKRNGRNQIAY